MDIYTQIKPNKKKALFLAKRELPVLVCDAVNLEGINYTLPEVQTLLDGITVGGHKITDEIITLNQAKAWEFLFDAIGKNQFSLSKDFACQLHAIAGTTYLPPQAATLDNLWIAMVQEAEKINNPFKQAVFVFLQMARKQFFYDVNKRMGRFMMNGLLLNKGYPVINVPAKRQLEFNQLMLAFYSSGDIDPMMVFMQNCIDERLVVIMSE